MNPLSCDKKNNLSPSEFPAFYTPKNALEKYSFLKNYVMINERDMSKLSKNLIKKKYSHPALEQLKFSDLKLLQTSHL